MRQDNVTSADHKQHNLGSPKALTQHMEGDHGLPESSPVLSPINYRINVQTKGNEDNPKGKKVEGEELTKLKRRKPREAKCFPWIKSASASGQA